MPDLQSDFEEKFNTVKNNYITSLNEKYNILRNLKSCIFKDANLNSESSINAINEAYGYIHKLSGSSAIFGYSELSQISNKLELSLKEFIENNYSSNEKVIFENLEILLIEINKVIKKD